MDKILTQVKRARKRLWVELCLNRLMKCCFVGLAMALIAIGVPKLVAVEGLPSQWSLFCVVAGIAGGSLAAVLWTTLHNRSQLDAAVEIDSRFGLKERVASSLSLSSADAESPAGRALVADAVQAIRRVDIGQRFGIQLSRRSWLPLVTTALGVALVMLVDDRQAQSSIDPQANVAAKEQVDNAAESLRKRLEERRKQAAEKGLKDAEGLFRKLEKETEDLTKKNEGDRKKALVKLSDLSKELQKQREALGGQEELRKQLERMKNLQRGPADKMLDAMKQGDWQSAKQELQKLKQQLEDDELNAQDKEQLQQQLQQLEQKLAEAAEARKQAMEQLRQQIEQQKEQGNLAQAGEMQQKLDELQRQQNLMDGLGQMTQQMAQCQECLKRGDSASATEAMDQMMQQLDELQQQAQEGTMIDSAMDQLQMAKDAMNCQQCQGAGCQACQGGGNRYGPNPGNGIGTGRGFGPRPEEKDVNFRDSRVRQQPGVGAAVIVGEAEGPNIRGQVSEAIQEEMGALSSTPTDPQVIERLPKSRREHTEQYFNMLREGR